MFILGLVLLLAKIDPIAEKQDYKKNTLKAYSNSYVKIILALPIKVITLHI